MSGKQKYESDIRLGERYRDTQTGIEGHVTAITFFQHGCERVSIEAVVNGEIKEYGFDAPRMVHIETNVQASSPRVGGPEKGVSHRRPGAVSR